MEIKRRPFLNAVHRAEIEDTYAEAFRSIYAEVLITARDRVWLDYIILFADILKSAVTQFADPVPYWPSSPSANFE